MIDKEASLLSTIRAALDASPPAVAQPGTLCLHTLFSIPRQVKSLYPLAHIHPTDLEYNKKASPIIALEEQIFVTASWAPSTSSQPSPAQHTSDDRDVAETRHPEHAENDSSAPLLVLAMQLYLYTIPELGSAVLYISKLDSSGYGPKAIPSALRERLSKMVFDQQEKRFGNTLKVTLTSAVTQHFSTFRHWHRRTASGVNISHLSVHVLARSQAAYLFPSSPENKGKKVLSDGGLIKWWRSAMSHVVVDTRDESSPIRKAHQNKGQIDARAYYVIPGYNKIESHPLVPLIRDDPASETSSSQGATNARTAEQMLREANWTYGHPYSPAGASCSQTDLPPLPLHWHTSSFILSNSTTKVQAQAQTDPNAKDYDPKCVRTVPTLMPHFSDDPKTRFLDETARDAHEHSGWKKKSTPTTLPENADATAPGMTNEGKENRSKQDIDIANFERQDENGSGGRKRSCDDGEVLNDDERVDKRAKTESAVEMQGSVSKGVASSGLSVPLVTVRALMRERQAMDDLPIDDFWERLAFRQECCSGNAIGVLVILFTRHPTSSDSGSCDSSTKGALERQPLSLPYKCLDDLVFKSLMKDSCEWNKISHARQLTQNWFHSVDKEVKRKGGIAQFVENHVNNEKEALVGENLIWSHFVLTAPTKVQLEKAEEEAKISRTAEVTGQRGTNMLSVKRKKKPTS